MDDKDAEKLTVKFPYFERGGEATLWDEGATYVQHEAHEFQNTATAEFNHGMGEIIQALLDAGLRITGIKEHQTVPWDAVPGQMEDIGGAQIKAISLPQVSITKAVQNGTKRYIGPRQAQSKWKPA
ncbi:hypothetical protein PWT90_10898 [Aphanocladium album]|nr:hypothetical protein PWT90_10898 [Aphanocladium album]